MRQGGNIKGRCPFHSDPGPSFVVTPHKGLAKCFGCHKTFFDPIKFIAELRAKGTANSTPDYAETLLFLRKRFALGNLIPAPLYEKIRAHVVYQKYKDILCRFMCELLLEAIATFPMDVQTELYWAKPTIDYLRTRKLGEFAPGELRAASEYDTEEEGAAAVADPYGVYPSIAANQLLGIFPPKAVVAKRFGEDSEEYKFFCSYFGKYANEGHNFVGHLVFPLHSEPSSVGRFKLRSPSATQKDMCFVDDDYDVEMGGFRGFYGLHNYRTLLGPVSIDSKTYVDTAVVVEGEFDALSSIAQQIRRQTQDFIVLSLGGASVQPLERLLPFGIEKVRIVTDRDKGGDSIVRLVLERTRTDKMSFSVFDWPDEYTEWRDPSDPERRIKDPDEAVKWLGYPKWARYVNSTGPGGSYTHTHEWCAEQASKEIAGVSADDVKGRGRIAAQWGKLLRDRQECMTYCAAISKSYNLDSVALMADIRTRDEGEKAFIERLSEIILDDFHPVGLQNAESRKRLLVMWHKETRTTNSFVLNDERAIETALAGYFGPIYDFITDRVGEPGFMLPQSGEDEEMTLTVKAKRYREYLNFALLNIAQGLPAMDHAPQKAQGMHFVSYVNGEMLSYIVNGKDIYRMTHGSDGAFDVKLLDGPSDNGFVFDNTGPAWLESATKAEDFINKDVDIVKLYRTLREMLDGAWSMRHQALDPTFLALFSMALPVMPVFTRQTSIMVNAEASSGKSRLTAGFIGGTGFPAINVVAHSVSLSQYSAAGIRQQRNNSTLTLSMEEFEDYGTNDAKSLTTRKCLEMFRDQISESPVRITIGTPSGDSKTYNLRFPLVCSAIKPLRDAASISRFIGFEMVHDPRRSDPVTVLIEKYGVAGIKKIRHELAVGLYPHMPRLRELQLEVEKEFSVQEVLPAHAPSRFREAMYPVIAMLRLVAELAKKAGMPSDTVPDYRRFAYDFADSRKEQLARLKSASEHDQVFESVLSSSIQIANADESNRVSGVTTIRIMLADINRLDEINKTKKGVYIDLQNEWLVVNWIEAAQGVLANTRYRNEATTFMKQVSERSPYHVPPPLVKDRRVLERLVDHMGPCQSMDLISVFSVKHMLTAARSHRERLMGTVGAAPVETPATQDINQAQTIDGVTV